MQDVAYFMQMQNNTSLTSIPEQCRLSFPDNGINVKWKMRIFLIQRKNIIFTKYEVQDLAFSANLVLSIKGY